MEMIRKDLNIIKTGSASNSARMVYVIWIKMAPIFSLVKPRVSLRDFTALWEMIAMFEHSSNNNNNERPYL
jgi:hypothetical protein